MVRDADPTTIVILPHTSLAMRESTFDEFHFLGGNIATATLVLVHSPPQLMYFLAPEERKDENSDLFSFLYLGVNH